MRVRVTLDVYQPLCRGRVIKLKEGGKTWVNFKYERLPNICYWCGCFDHSDKDCDLWIQSKGSLQLESQQFGTWLRAVPSAASHNRVTRVSGFYEGREENLSTRRRRAERQKPIPVATPNAEDQSDKEIPNLEAKYTGFNDNNAAESTVLNMEMEHNIRDREINGDFFSQQIREIDKEIGYNETSPLSDINSFAGNIFTPVAAHDNPRELLKEPRDSLKVHSSPLKNISNMANLIVVAEKPPYSTWKRLARLSVSSQVTPDDCVGCKRPVDMIVDHYELPSKKLVVSNSDKENYPVLAATGFQSR